MRLLNSSAPPRDADPLEEVANRWTSGFSKRLLGCRCAGEGGLAWRRMASRGLRNPRSQRSGVWTGVLWSKTSSLNRPAPGSNLFSKGCCGGFADNPA